jgi:RHS repeat-associated protein
VEVLVIEPAKSRRAYATTALAAAAALVLSMLVAPPALATTAEHRATPQRQREVRGHPAVAVKAAVADASIPAWRVAAPRWPQAANGEVSLPAAGEAQATIGGLPVALAPVARASAGTASAQRAAAPGQLRVQVFDQATTAAVGLAGVLLRLSPGSGTAATAAKITVDYSSFRYAYGGDWAARLHLVRLPDCALTAPRSPGCSAATPVASVNTLSASTVSADVSSGVYALEATASGGAGDYSATSLTPASSWSVGEQTGDFDWSYPLDTPPVPTDDDLDLDLTYTSQSVDGRTASTNNQTSWVGEGFALNSGYVERSYKACTDAGGPAGNGDMCWGGDNATLVLKGHSTELIHDDATGAWHLKDDDGSKMELVPGANNGDKYGQYWRLTMPDGTQYVFGVNHPGSAPGTAATNSVWTMPVYTTDRNDPCYNASFASSWCLRAWRWNLDYVVDPHGNASTVWYVPETNYYRRGYLASSGANGTVTQYTRGGYLKEIDYGQTSTTTYSASAPAKVVFGVSERCLSTSTFNCETASNFTKANASHWPDVPFDLNCNSDDACGLNISPSFWSRKRLTTVTTQVLSGSSYVDVDRWTLAQSFPAPGDGTSPALWLDSITRSGRVGGALALPPVKFGKTQLQNRVDTVGDGLPKLDKLRVGTIDTESGGHISVTYSTPDCTPTDKPSPATNTRRCYPIYWAGSPPQPKPFLDWFHKYVVTQVVEHDSTGGAPDEVTTYTYDTPAWHFDDHDGLVKDKYKTWGQYRGYSKVSVLEGDPNGQQSQTDMLFLRGMDGDRSDPTDATKKRSVVVPDLNGLHPVTDADPLQGFPRETIRYNGAGGAMVDDVLDDPWTRLSATRVRTWGTTTANVVETGATHTSIALAAGGVRRTETDSTFTNEGLVQKVDDHGDLATAADDQCVRTTYARNDSKWLINYVSRVETVAVACAATPDRPGDVVSDVRTSYDGQTYGVAPTKGDPTRTERVASYNATTPTYITDETTRYDAYGRVIEVSDAMGRKNTTAYTPAIGGPVTKIVETDYVTATTGYSTTTTLDPTRGLATVTSDPNGKVTELAYDPLGRLTQLWLPGRLRSANATTPNMKYAYHVDGAASPSWVSSGTLRPDLTYTTEYQLYDGLLRERQTQAPAPGGGRALTDTFYDARGLVTRANGNYHTSGSPGGTLFIPTDAVPGQTVTSYDGAERPVKQALYKDGNHLWDTLTSYGGDRVTVTPPKGGIAGTTVTDARGRTVQLLQYKSGSTGAADTTTYTYTPAGDIATVVDATGLNTWTNRYNLLRQKESQTDPDAGTTTYTYNNDDEVTSSTDARGTTLAYSYDGLGRRTGEYLGSLSGTQLAGWTYDTVAKGQLTGSTRYVNGLAYSTTIASYDDGYQPTQTTTVIPKYTSTSAAQQALAGTYTTFADYNTSTDGTPHRISYPAAGGLAAETILYTYDNLGQPLTMSGIASYVSGTTYSSLANGDISALTLGTGTAAVTRTNTYEDATGRLKRVVDQRQATPITVNDTRYAYDDAGDITQVSNLQQDGRTDNQCFQYDYLRRLTEAWTPTGDCQTAPSASSLGGPAPYWQSYRYDLTGNRIASTDHIAGGDTTTTETYPADGATQPHTLTSLTRHNATGDTTTSYQYDPDGNLKRRTRAGSDEAFTWDAEGRLATVSNGGSVTSYLYDTDGDQLIEADPTGATLYLDDMEIRANATGAVNATRYYTVADDTVAARTATGLTWILTNDQNTGLTEVSADQTQAVTRRYQTPFGDQRGTQAVGWTGQRGFVGGTDNPTTGLLTVGARQYDPGTGRFISADPIIDPTDPQQLNAYAYAKNTPVTLSDPDGLRPVGDSIHDTWSHNDYKSRGSGYRPGSHRRRHHRHHAHHRHHSHHRKTSKAQAYLAACSHGVHAACQGYHHIRHVAHVHHMTYLALSAACSHGVLSACRGLPHRTTTTVFRPGQPPRKWKTFATTKMTPWWKKALANAGSHLTVSADGCLLVVLCEGATLQGGVLSGGSTLNAPVAAREPAPLGGGVSAGWSTATPEEKDSSDTQGVCLFLGIGGCFSKGARKGLTHEDGNMGSYYDFSFGAGLGVFATNGHGSWSRRLW